MLRMLLCAGGCAHGYQTLDDKTEMHYMTSGFYVPSLARGVRFDDPAFKILWPLVDMAVFEQDLKWPLLER